MSEFFTKNMFTIIYFMNEIGGISSKPILKYIANKTSSIEINRLLSRMKKQDLIEEKLFSKNNKLRIYFYLTDKAKSMVPCIYELSSKIDICDMERIRQAIKFNEK